MTTDQQSHPWIFLGKTGEVKEGVYFAGADEIWLTTIAGQRVAVSNICPHKMGPLSKGTVNGNLVRCPWHGYWFDAVTGKCTPSLKLRRYEIKEESGGVYVRLIVS